MMWILFINNTSYKLGGGAHWESIKNEICLSLCISKAFGAIPSHDDQMNKKIPILHIKTTIVEVDYKMLKFALAPFS